MTFCEVCLGVGQPEHILGGELPPVRAEQCCHLPHVIGDGGQPSDGRWIVANTDDERPFPTRLAPRTGGLGSGLYASGTGDRVLAPGVLWR